MNKRLTTIATDIKFVVPRFTAGKKKFSLENLILLNKKNTIDKKRDGKTK